MGKSTHCDGHDFGLQCIWAGSITSERARADQRNEKGRRPISARAFAGGPPHVQRPADRDTLMMRRQLLFPFLTLLWLTNAGCSIRGYAINQLGNALAEGGSTYESDEDIQLVGDALPFGLKLIESLLEEAPEHEGLLLAASQGFTTYGYVYVQRDADFVANVDLSRARTLRSRARRLYMRAHDYGLRGLDKRHRGFSAQLQASPESAVGILQARDVPLTYWAAASLGSAISVGRNDPAMIARLPEVDALIQRAMALDETWENGTLHEFEIGFAATRPEGPNYDDIRSHYERALELSMGRRAAVHVAYAEAASIPQQDSVQFREILERALAIDPNDFREVRLANLIAQERAEWLLDHVDDLILESNDFLEGDAQ